MSISVNDFWRLAVDTRLLSAEECQHLDSAFGRVRGAQQGNAATLAEWLTATGVMSRYQAHVLLAGKARPFLFGDYKVFDRHESDRLKGLYRAVHLTSGYSVAIYFLSSKLLADERHLTPVLRQARWMAGVREEHLCRVFELVERKSTKFVVLEDLAGVTLAEFLLSQTIAPPDGCRIVRDLALATAALHENGQAHGDIRPQNIWLTADGGVKLLGFPLARDPAQAASYRVDEGEPSARLAAQADYLAPELAFGRRTPDARADIYSLGCLAYRLLIGRPPFAEGDVLQKLARHASEPAVPLEQFGMPPALCQLIAHMMAKNPPVRLDSAAEVAAQLVPFASPDPTAGRPVSPVLQAFEQCLAQRQPAPEALAPAASAGQPAEKRVAPRGETRRETPGPAMPGPARSGPTMAGPTMSGPMMPGPVMPLDSAPLDHLDGAAGGLAVAHRPAALVERTPLGDEIVPVRPRVKRSKSKGRKINPIALSAGVLALFALAGVVAGLATRPATPEPSAVATTADPGSEAPPKHKKKKKPRPEPESPTKTVDDGDTYFEDDPPAVAQETPTAKPVRPNPRQPDKQAFQEVDDDRVSLWASPTAGGPISVRYMPSGALAFVAVRPSALIGNSEGAKMIDGLGPWGQAAKDYIQALVGLDPTRIEQLVVGFYVSDSGALSTAYTVRFNDAVEEGVLTGGWKDPPAAEHGGKKYFKGSEYAYYLPPEDKGRIVAIVPVGQIDEMLDAEGPMLGKDLDKLVAHSDTERHFSLLGAPRAVFREGKPLFGGELARLEEPLKQFLGADLPAALLSFHLASDLFVELRVVGDTTDEPYELAKKYQKQMEGVPDAVENYANSINGQYGRAVLSRFPMMIRTLYDFTRTGEEHRQGLLRAYLPLHAGHNLVMATELALFAAPGGAAGVAVKNPASQRPSGPAEALKQKISLSFPRDTLEKSMEMLGREIDTEIVILGGDLQLEGITKNQSFGLDERDKPAEEILRTVLNKANPDGKLVYVIKPKDGGKDAIFITTRAAVEKRGDKLPPELVQNPAKAK